MAEAEPECANDSGSGTIWRGGSTLADLRLNRPASFQIDSSIMAEDGQDFRGFVQEFIDSEFGHIKSLHNVESILRKVEEDKKGLEDQSAQAGAILDIVGNVRYRRRERSVASRLPKPDRKLSDYNRKGYRAFPTAVADIPDYIQDGASFETVANLTEHQPTTANLAPDLLLTMAGGVQYYSAICDRLYPTLVASWIVTVGHYQLTQPTVVPTLGIEPGPWRNDIQQSVLVNSLGGAVNFFAEMFDICEVLQKSRCEKLVQFSNSTILFWHRILKDKLSRMCVTVGFKHYKLASVTGTDLLAMHLVRRVGPVIRLVPQLGWPFLGVATHIPPRVPRPTHLELTFRLETLFEQLLKIQIPDTIGKRQSSQPSPGSDEADRPFLLPLQLLLKPLRKRFKFHFTGSKQTNALDKPEWYLTQILGWIRDHTDFLDHHIQPLLNRAGYPHVEAKLEFTRGLLMLVADKLAQDMDSLLYDEHLFSHTVDEVLLFDRELRGSYSYPASQPGVLHVLTVQDTFHRWITVERKFAVEKMDLLFSSETAWTSQYGDIEDVDDMKTGECAEGFMTLMLALTDRYKPLPSAANKLEFLDLQLELLDDFRIRLTQVMKSEAQDPLGSTFLSILNAVNYVISVLREWSETVFFLQLQYSRAEQYRVRASSDLPLPQDPDLSSLQGAVFDELITLFQLLRTDMLSVVSNLVFTEMKARSKDYKDEK
ncbi:RAD50-interacting protein 1 [Branchiostoma belcheri]|nr:RAD50-interacting protein 1 [Branchiostoma belcheri]